jgi:hypothetical protein
LIIALVANLNILLIISSSNKPPCDIAKEYEECPGLCWCEV